MIDFEELESSLKTKWLDYYKNNCSWIKYLSGQVTIQLSNKQTIQVNRPKSALILAVISILEPKVKDWLIFLSLAESDPNKIVLALGLHFNPEEMLKQQNSETNESEKQTISQLDSSDSNLIKFEDLKQELKDQWLNYYESNEDWICSKLAMWQKTSADSDEKRPNSGFLLGFALTVEPRIKKMLTPLFRMDPSGENIISILGLNCDPRVELENREQNQPNQVVLDPYFPNDNSSIDELEKIRAEIRKQEQKID